MVLSRGFLLANASATVVSLWSVDDRSTAALMSIKYKHLAQGCTVPQALQLAMLGLARRPPHIQTRDLLQEPESVMTRKALKLAKTVTKTS